MFLNPLTCWRALLPPAAVDLSQREAVHADHVEACDYTAICSEFPPAKKIIESEITSL